MKAPVTQQAARASPPAGTDAVDWSIWAGEPAAGGPSRRWHTPRLTSDAGAKGNQRSSRAPWRCRGSWASTGKDRLESRGRDGSRSEAVDSGRTARSREGCVSRVHGFADLPGRSNARVGDAGARCPRRALSHIWRETPGEDSASAYRSRLPRPHTLNIASRSRFVRTQCSSSKRGRATPATLSNASASSKGLNSKSSL